MPQRLLLSRPAPPSGATLSLTQQRALFGVLCLVWGTTWIALKIGTATVPPGFFSGTRWALAGVALAAFRIARRGKIDVPRRLWFRLTVVAVLMVSLNSVIQLYGLRYVPAGLATVINSALTPISLVGFSIGLGQDRFSVRQALALALGVGGILLVFGPQALRGHLGWPEAIGLAEIIFACLCYSLGSVMARPLMRSMGPVELSAILDCIGGFLLIPLSLLFEPGAQAALVGGGWDWASFASWLYLLIPSSLVATVIYLLLMRDWGAGRTGSYALVTPVVGVVTAVLMLGETVNASEVFGMVVMVVAAGLVLKRPTPARGTEGKAEKKYSPS